MTSIAPLHREPLRAAGSPPILSPATLVEDGAALMVVRRGEETPHPVTLAVAAPYRPTVGDEVLVVGNDDDGWYLIGVLHGHAPAVLDVAGDLRIEAQGRMELVGHAGVAIAGPDVELRGRRLVRLFDRVTERCSSLFQSVRDLACLRAGRTETTVEGTHHLRAENANVVTRERVKINGRAIHLG
ncbi:MAG: DUF3540 domain-containing protein [Myxococcota bacterium]